MIYQKFLTTSEYTEDLKKDVEKLKKIQEGTKRDIKMKSLKDTDMITTYCKLVVFFKRWKFISYHIFGGLEKTNVWVGEVSKRMYRSLDLALKEEVIELEKKVEIRKERIDLLDLIVEIQKNTKKHRR